MECGQCKGRGVLSAESVGTHDCWKCGGTGEEPSPVEAASAVAEEHVPHGLDSEARGCFTGHDFNETPGTRWAVFYDVEAERLRQDARWGEQNHPMTGAVFPRGTKKEGRDAAMVVARYFGIPTEKEARNHCEEEHREKRGTYTHIAVEELAEFVDACVKYGNTSDEARTELVQLTAVCVAMLEAMGRARAKLDAETRARTEATEQ